MKIEDVYIGQKVGFTYNGSPLVGFVKEIKKEIHKGVEKDIIVVHTVEHDEVEIIPKRLLGLL